DLNFFTFFSGLFANRSFYRVSFDTNLHQKLWREARRCSRRSVVFKGKLCQQFLLTIQDNLRFKGARNDRVPLRKAANVYIGPCIKQKLIVEFDLFTTRGWHSSFFSC